MMTLHRRPTIKKGAAELAEKLSELEKKEKENQGTCHHTTSHHTTSHRIASYHSTSQGGMAGDGVGDHECYMTH